MTLEERLQSVARYCAKFYTEEGCASAVYDALVFERKKALEEAAMVARRGGCDCPRAPCDHDEAAIVIEQRILALLKPAAGKEET